MFQGRKYRDELRPRQGLLRTKEFLMKDLYTFDTTREAAMTAYQDVSAAYRAFFTDLQLPYVVASADSGNMGGDVSHEYHFLTPHGEDNVVSCTHCDYVANEEVAQKGPLRLSTPVVVSDGKDLNTWTGITKDRKTLVVVYFPRSSDKSQLPNPTETTESTEAVNPRSVGKLVPQIDLSIEEAVATWSKEAKPKEAKSKEAKSKEAKSKEAKSEEAKSKEATNDGDSPSGILHIYDARLSSDTKARLQPGHEESWIPSDLKAVYSKTTKIREIVALDSTGRAVDLTRIQNGDRCHHCSEPALRIQRGIEVGHTFHLGTRYSEPLRVAVSRPKNTAAHLQMGCHGIGLSRLIGAVSAVTSTSQGLRWPRAIAPFDAAIIVSGNGSAIREDIERCYDILSSYKISKHRREVLQTEDHSSDGKDAGALSNAGHFLAESVPGGNFIDPVIDDREKDTGWKLKDTDLIGYPIVVILGKSWSKSKLAEVKCPVLGSNDLVPLEALAGYIAERLINYTKKTIT
ncbi:MAG: hypothetical protein M1821_007730 [Bathelium mastoideum]|nr:MAG: hypothetical protein M1821_007730 [Bathelium mastoideum]